MDSAVLRRGSWARRALSMGRDSSSPTELLLLSAHPRIESKTPPTRSQFQTISTYRRFGTRAVCLGATRSAPPKPYQLSSSRTSCSIDRSSVKPAQQHPKQQQHEARLDADPGRPAPRPGGAAGVDAHDGGPRCVSAWSVRGSVAAWADGPEQGGHNKHTTRRRTQSNPPQHHTYIHTTTTTTTTVLRALQSGDGDSGQEQGGGLRRGGRWWLGAEGDKQAGDGDNDGRGSEGVTSGDKQAGDGDNDGRRPGGGRDSGDDGH